MPRGRPPRKSEQVANREDPALQKQGMASTRAAHQTTYPARVVGTDAIWLGSRLRSAVPSEEPSEEPRGSSSPSLSQEYSPSIASSITPSPESVRSWSRNDPNPDMAESVGPARPETDDRWESPNKTALGEPWQGDPVKAVLPPDQSVPGSLPQEFADYLEALRSKQGRTVEEEFDLFFADNLADMQLNKGVKYNAKDLQYFDLGTGAGKAGSRAIKGAVKGGAGAAIVAGLGSLICPTCMPVLIPAGAKSFVGAGAAGGAAAAMFEPGIDVRLDPDYKTKLSFILIFYLLKQNIFNAIDRVEGVEAKIQALRDKIYDISLFLYSLFKSAGSDEFIYGFIKNISRESFIRINDYSKSLRGRPTGQEMASPPTHTLPRLTDGNVHRGGINQGGKGINKKKKSKNKKTKRNRKKTKRNRKKTKKKY